MSTANNGEIEISAAGALKSALSCIMVSSWQHGLDSCLWQGGISFSIAHPSAFEKSAKFWTRPLQMWRPTITLLLENSTRMANAKDNMGRYCFIWLNKCNGIGLKGVYTLTKIVYRIQANVGNGLSLLQFKSFNLLETIGQARSKNMYVNKDHFWSGRLILRYLQKSRHK